MHVSRDSFPPTMSMKFWTSNNRQCLLLALVVFIQALFSVSLFLAYVASTRTPQTAIVKQQQGPSLAAVLGEIGTQFDFNRTYIIEVLADNASRYTPPFLLWCHEPGEWICDRVVSHGQYEAQLYDYFFLPLLDSHPERSEVLFVDIGANMGIWSVFFASRGFPTISVEPSPMNIARLRANAILNGCSHLVDAHRLGVGERNETVRVSWWLRNTGVSFIHNTTNSTDAEVQIVTIDHFARISSQCARNRPLYLKIDIEGSETKFLRGALPLLASGCVRAFFIEMLEHFHPLPEIIGVGLLLNSIGFQLATAYSDQLWIYDPALFSHETRVERARHSATILCSPLARNAWRHMPLCSDGSVTRFTESEVVELAQRLGWRAERDMARDQPVVVELGWHILFNEWRHLLLKQPEQAE
jgi:FkbM family methyltransferase